MDVVGTDGIVGLIALFVAEQAAPTIGEPDPVVAAFEREIFGDGGPVSVAQPTTRTDALLATGKHFGVEVSRHPETDELITERHVFYRGVKGKQREYEDVSLILALCKWLLAYGGAAGSDEQIVEFARRVWIRTEGLEA